MAEPTLVDAEPLIEEVECDPEIEECEDAELVEPTEVEEVNDDDAVAEGNMEQPAGSQAVLILGVISVVKALVPLVLKLIASNANEKMTAIWKPNAGLLWWVGNLAIWLPLAIMWLLVSPGSGLADPFL